MDGRLDIDYDTIKTLLPGRWTNTAVIEWCLCAVVDRACNSPPDGAPPVRAAVCSSSFYETSSERPARFTGPPLQPCRFDELDLICFPWHDSGHWSLAVLCHPGVGPLFAEHLASTQRGLQLQRTCFAGTTRSGESPVLVYIVLMTIVLFVQMPVIRC